MANKVYSYYKELPDWAKGVVVVGGGLVAFLVIRKVFKVVFPSEKQRRNQQLTQNVNTEIRNLEFQGQKPSYSESQYLTFANTIFNGIRYCWGDDYGTVEETMKRMKNDLDVAKLIKAFGRRRRACFGIPTGGEDDLFTSIQAELGQDFGGLTNYRVDRINNDWKKKGITYVI